MSSVRGPVRRPSSVLLTARAADAMDVIARDVYGRHGTEWGGVTFGRVGEVDGRIVVTVTDATRGICANATAGSVEILPESWEDGERQLRAAGRSPGLRIGTWHSHPCMSAFPSSHMDLPSWHGYAYLPHFVAIIVNPFSTSGPDRSVWALHHGEFRRLVSIRSIGRLGDAYLEWTP